MAKKKVKAKKKAAKSDQQRVAEHRQRLSESGIIYLQVKIPERSLNKLDRLCGQQNVTRDELVNQLIKAA